MATVFEQAINNGTVLVRDFIKSTQQNDVAGLYAGVNPAQLNWLELAWMNWYSWVGNTTLATGIMSFVMHEASLISVHLRAFGAFSPDQPSAAKRKQVEPLAIVGPPLTPRSLLQVVYFGRCLPWMIIDYMGWFKQYKLQADKVPSAKQQWECTKEVLKTHFSVELPQIYLFHPMAVAVGMKTWEVPFPSFFGQIVPQVMLFFFMEDFWHYTVHRIMHHRALYKHVHKVHHTYSAPFGLAAEYAHPIEVLVLGLGTVGGPLLWCYLSGGNMHLITMYTWICCRLFQAVDAHSGYDFPWSLNHWLPIWAGAEHHDYHHEKFNECFSSSLRVWDWLLGTDQKYHAYRKAQAEAKTAKKAQ